VQKGDVVLRDPPPKSEGQRLEWRQEENPVLWEKKIERKTMGREVRLRGHFERKKINLSGRGVIWD